MTVEGGEGLAGGVGWVPGPAVEVVGGGEGLPEPGAELLVRICWLGGDAGVWPWTLVWVVEDGEDGLEGGVGLVPGVAVEEAGGGRVFPEFVERFGLAGEVVEVVGA